MWTQKGDEDVSFLKTMRRREGGKETRWLSTSQKNDDNIIAAALVIHSRSREGGDEKTD